MIQGIGNPIIIISIILITLFILHFLDIYMDPNISESQIEHYDAKISNITLTRCGTECTKGINCAGFGYNHVDGQCFLSKRAIIGKPYESLYTDEYTKLDRRCNKINRLTDNIRIDGNTLTQNSVYICADGENNVATQFQYANLGATSLEGDKTAIFTDGDVAETSMPENVGYETYEIKWPTEKKDIELHSSTNNEDNETTKSVKYGFIESDKEFLGQYALAHQCVVNVPMYDCLKYCENNPNCAGTEWNRGMVKTDGTANRLYENVCCPKSIIKQIIPRRNEFNRGKFYVKKELSDIDKRDRIVVTKADFSIDPPTNPRFDLKIVNNPGPPDINDPADPVPQDATFVNGFYDTL
jgi:hypothetical protein